MDDFLLFVAVGFAAQLVDGAIGMAYGLTATTTLLSVGTRTGHGECGRARGGGLHHRRLGVAH